MQLTPQSIFSEYRAGVDFKSAIGNRGMYEQNRINERFYSGDQWYGAKCGNERPLVRHNIIKRIGDYKMSQVIASPIAVSYSADGIRSLSQGDIKRLRGKLSADSEFKFSGEATPEEINAVMSALSDYRNTTAERLGFNSICGRALRNAYISGTAVLYSYWNPDLKTGIYSGFSSAGDISCEVLDIDNVYFGDPFETDVQQQPYIIIASRRSVRDVKREAVAFGADYSSVSALGDGEGDEKITVLTRLYREYKDNGETAIKCIKVTEKGIIRQEFDTGLTLYPISVFRWEDSGNSIYGESEVTYLIPNQIAINRMITASVWSAMTMGMPLMVVNGDTVADNITNDPGQIIKIFGSNEDVAGAVKYIAPPESCRDFGSSINELIENTLTQSGANEAALGDSRPDNAAALEKMQNAALLPLRLIKNRFFDFLEQTSRIWADFWIKKSGFRYIKISDENGVWYMPFDAARYEGLSLSVRVDVGTDIAYSASESIAVLSSLYEKGIINKLQYLKRLPKGSVPDISGLISEYKEESQNDGA